MVKGREGGGVRQWCTGIPEGQCRQSALPVTPCVAWEPHTRSCNSTCSRVSLEVVWKREEACQQVMLKLSGPMHKTYLCYPPGNALHRDLPCFCTTLGNAMHTIDATRHQSAQHSRKTAIACPGECAEHVENWLSPKRTVEKLSKPS